MLVNSLNTNTLYTLIRSTVEGHVLEIQSTGIRIRSAPNKAISLEEHGILADPVCPDVQSQGCALAVRQNSAVQSKLSNGGVCNDNVLLSSRSIYGIANSHIAQLAARNKFTFFNDTKRVIGQGPNTTLRHIHFYTGSINCGGRKSIGSERNIVIILCFNVSMVKNTGFNTLLLGQEDRVNCWTFGTVRGDRAHSQIAFTFAAGNEGRGAAAVTVDCIDTAQCQHKFAHFIVA